MTDDYYEDSHGNRIICSYNGLKYAFSGFNSIVRIGENVNLNNSSFYIHSDVEIEIGDNCAIEESKWDVKQHAYVRMGNKCIIKKCVWDTDGAHIEIGNECNINDNYWIADSQSCIKLGDRGLYRKGSIVARGRVIIGRDFSNNAGFFLNAHKYTQIIIGDDVMCASNVVLRGNDGHSIFDVRTGMNINSTEEISKNRKIVIGNHVWLGMHATILYNTEICDGSIIGTESLVKSRIPNNCIAAGIPARVIRKDIAWSRKDCADQLMEHEQAYARLTEM